MYLIISSTIIDCGADPALKEQTHTFLSKLNIHQIGCCTHGKWTSVQYIETKRTGGNLISYVIVGFCQERNDTINEYIAELNNKK